MDKVFQIDYILELICSFLKARDLLNVSLVNRKCFLVARKSLASSTNKFFYLSSRSGCEDSSNQTQLSDSSSTAPLVQMLESLSALKRSPSPFIPSRPVYAGLISSDGTLEKKEKVLKECSLGGFTMIPDLRTYLAGEATSELSITIYLAHNAKVLQHSIPDRSPSLLISTRFPISFPLPDKIQQLGASYCQCSPVEVIGLALNRFQANYKVTVFSWDDSKRINSVLSDQRFPLKHAFCFFKKPISLSKKPGLCELLTTTNHENFSLLFDDSFNIYMRSTGRQFLQMKNISFAFCGHGVRSAQHRFSSTNDDEILSESLEFRSSLPFDPDKIDSMNQTIGFVISSHNEPIYQFLSLIQEVFPTVNFLGTAVSCSESFLKKMRQTIPDRGKIGQMKSEKIISALENNSIGGRHFKIILINLTRNFFC
ncbi:uncharacterized protein LOC141855847 [Brevipalpus obovatus]|uniref:uncharacterized protein LOC141855847 n=1 Tax=Brevipalpus obovatus TaxID=246614 RepID=UPI003D9EA375